MRIGGEILGKLIELFKPVVEAPIFWVGVGLVIAWEIWKRIKK